MAGQDDKKRAAAEAALAYVMDDDIVGVGTGSTANYFIDALATRKARISGAVASSEASAARLRGHGIQVLELNAVSDIPVYVDGADEANRRPGQPQVRVHHGRFQAGRTARRVSAAGRGHPHGAQLRRA